MQLMDSICGESVILNNYVIGGARDIGAYNNKHAASDIIIADY